jgi:MATE family multidrug resistance protein
VSTVEPVDARDAMAIDRRVVALAVPAIGALVADPLLGAVDTAVAARVSTEALGALGLAVALLAAGTWVFNFLVLGTTTTVARARGAGDPAAGGRRIVHAAVVAVGLGLVVAAILLAFAGPIVRASGAVDGLVGPAAAYLRVRAVGLPFLLLGLVGHGAFRGVGDTRTPLLVVVGSNLLNATLNGVLVFGFGFGLVGIAWATVAAEVAAVLLFVVLLRRLDIDLRGHGLPDRAALRDLVLVSRDIVLRSLALVLGLLLLATAAARVDAVTAAAHQILFQVFILSAFVLDSVAVASQSMVGEAMGRDDPDTVRRIARRLVGWGVSTGAVMMLLVALLGGVVPRLLTDDPAVLAAVASAWLVGALVQLPGGVAFVLDGVLMGAEDWAYLRTWTMIAGLGAGGAGLLAVSLGGGLVALWWCMVGLVVVRAAALTVRVARNGWVVAA